MLLVGGGGGGGGGADHEILIHDGALFLSSCVSYSSKRQNIIQINIDNRSVSYIIKIIYFCMSIISVY